MSALPIEPAKPAATAEEAVARVLDRVHETAALPQVVYKILELAASNDAGATELERAIVVDPGFSVKVLTCANSAYYGLPRKVTAIREAVMFLGFKAVRQLAMTVGVFDLFVGKTDAESLRRRAWWRCSLDTAICARWLASKHEVCLPDEAYTSGLLHCIGKTLLDRFDPEAFAVVETAMEGGSDILEAETLAYGCHHVELAQAAARKWGFPSMLVDSLDYVAGPPDGNPARALAACVSISDAIAELHSQGATLDADAVSERFASWSLQALDLQDPHVLVQAVAEGCSQITAGASVPL